MAAKGQGLFSLNIWIENFNDLLVRNHWTDFNARQSAQWGTYTPDQRYRHFLKSTKYVALTLEMAVVCYTL